MLNYEIKGKGKTLVFLHGYMENLSIWDDLTNHFSISFQTITIDLPGHGKSECFAETHSIELQAEKVKTTLDTLGISNFSLIGHSMGGYVVLSLAELYPDNIEHIALINSSSLADSKTKREQRFRAVQTAEKNLELLVNLSIPALFAEKNRPHLANEIQKTKEIALSTSISGIQAALRGMADRPDRSFVLNNFNKPILIVVGLLDQTVDPNLFLAIIPEKDNIHVEKLSCGHMAFIEEKEVLTHILTHFLED